MSKLVIIYKGNPNPVEGKNKKQVIAKMHKDWNRQQQDSDLEHFTTHGIDISYQDFSTNSFEVKTLDEWFDENKVKS